jgi:hypothetical protein
MIIGLAIAGLALVIATLLWFSSDTPRDPNASANTDDDRTNHAKTKRSTAPTNRPTDAANAARSSATNSAHLALPAQLSADISPYGALEGRIVDWNTRVGVIGAELEFVSGGITHSTITGPDGGYRFEAPSEAAWSLAIVTAEGYLPYAPELGRGGVVWTPSPYQKLERADLFLFPSIDYAGTVVDAEGRPVADAQIELFGADSGELALVGIESSFQSDGDGRFEFHAPNFALLEARHPDHPPGRARVDEPAQRSHTLTITLGGVPTGSQAVITGRIIDAADQPLAGVEIRAMPTRIGGDPSLARSPTAVSDAEGRFVLAPLDDLAYVVGARLSARPGVQSRPVKPGAEVELRVDDGLELSGRLIDDHGAAIVAGSVSLLRVTGPLRRSRVAGLSVFDPDGAFSFGGLSPGHYELEAIAQGRARSKPVAVKLPRAGDPVTIVLNTGGGSVYGRVVDASTGEPLPLAQVSVNGLASGDSVMPSLSSTVTDPEGAFELTGIESGRVSVDVSAYEHDGKIVSGIQIVAGDRHGPLEITLAPVAEGERPKTELAGIGVAIAPARDAIFIRDVVEGGGAEAAGIVVGDSIVAVDGVSVIELGFETAIQNIRGQVGTTVALEVRRKGATEDHPESLIVERRLISGA